MSSEARGAEQTRRIGIIGAGPGGICMAIKLREAGIDSFTIFERAPAVGGTWFHNTYPGCACDVQSALYSFSFELKRDWSRPYGTQPEIHEYFEHCVAKYGLAPHLRLGVGIAAAAWDDERAVWHLTTEQGDEHEFDVVIGAVGMFGNPAVPEIPGMDQFAGTVFHSARWDHDHDLAGERVAVIGSAASAVQFVPEIAPRVDHLVLYQRTPNWVLPKVDDPYTPEELERLRTDPEALLEARQQVWERVEGAITFSDPKAILFAQELASKSMAIVEDPEVRAKLTPDFPHGCKRPLVSNVWYPTFNRPNVELVTEAIERIDADGIVTTDGVHRPVDTIVLATGFETTRYLATIEVTGRNGRHLDDAWSDGAQAYLGITTAGFPNLFMLYGPNTNNGSILFMIECQVAYVMRQVARLDREALAWVDVRPEVMADYNRALQDDLDHVDVWSASCNNYYRGPSGTIVTQWPHTMTEYEARTATPDDDAYERFPESSLSPAIQR
jgi:cation diffusion facilitator CzcD-associated flavoprotein CzcO